jgi:hypothetical protein
LVEVLDDAVSVLLEDLGRYALHAEDLDLEALAVRESIIDLAQCFFVYLVKMDRQTWWNQS